MDWDYRRAFSRNLGVLTEAEQMQLRSKCVAIAGMGGVGGSHLVALLRAGVERFHIADPDSFDIENSNRQYGCFVDSYGHNKAEYMARLATRLNPNVQIQVFPVPIDENNVREFLQKTDLYLDGVDAFEIKARMRIFDEAFDQSIPSITAGPFGFGTGWVSFLPQGVRPSRYFDFSVTQDHWDQVAAFLAGVSPKFLSARYLDARYLDLKSGRAPSFISGVQLATGVLVADAIAILLGRPHVVAAPSFQAFDPYLHRYVRGRLWAGNRSWLQKWKRYQLKKFLTAHST